MVCNYALQMFRRLNGSMDSCQILCMDNHAGLALWHMVLLWNPNLEVQCFYCS